MSRGKVREDEGASAALYLVAASIIYLFGVLVFLPLVKSVGWEISEIVVAAIFVVVVAVFLYRGLPFIDTISHYLARRLGGWWIKRKDLDESKLDNVNDSMYLVVIMGALFLLWILLSPFLYSIHPALSGMFLLVIIFTNTYVFFIFLTRTRSLKQDEI